MQALYLDKKLLNHSLLQTIARVNRPYNELKGHGLILDYYGIFDHLNEARNYRPDELGDVAFPFDTILEHFRKTRRPDLYAQVRLAKGAWVCAISQ
jgi:type I restriction enzyme R subunit